MNSKKKGNKAERNVAKIFAEWTGWEFHRVPASGGLHWGKDHKVTGDIVPEAEHLADFPFVVEVKSRKKTAIDFSGLISYPESCNIRKFWDQVSGDAERVGKIPMLCMRYNGLPPDYYYVALPLGIAEDITYSGDRMIIPNLGIIIFELSELVSVDSKDLFNILTLRGNSRRKVRD